MSDERIQSMRRFIEQAPDNPFPRYALAMDLKGQGLLEEAAAELDGLAARLPDYVPTYLQWGMLLDELGETEAARAAFVRGIEAAQKAGDAHALSEIRSALDGLD